MIQFNVTVTRSGPTLGVVAKQTPFALANAINRTLEEGQVAMRAQLPREFTIRRPDFINRLVKIENADRARKDRLVGRMGIQGNRADILTKFETGGVKLPIRGKSLALPIDAKRNKYDIVPTGKRPGKLLGKAKQNRVFILQAKNGERLLMQRYGRKGSSQLRVLFDFKPEVMLKAQLNFYRTVLPVVEQQMPVNFYNYLHLAIRSAK